MTMTTMKEARAKIQAFANEHKLVFEDRGTCGFGRPCVGLRHGDSYVDYNPYDEKDYSEQLPEFFDERLSPPREVADSYHKHDCMAVLARGDEPNYDAAIKQLLAWIEHYEKIGVELVLRPARYSSTIEIMLKSPSIPTWKVKR